MANTLAQLFKNKSGLRLTSAEEAERIGRDSPPITPMETGVIGGSADQAKMAGTPNQKLNAMRQSIAPELDRDTIERRKQADTARLGVDKDVRDAELANLSNLGNLNDRVQQLALERFKLTSAQGSLAYTGDAELTDATKLSIESGTLTNSAILELAGALGLDSQSDLATLSAQVKSQLASGDDEKAEALAQVAAGEVTLGELFNADYSSLGFSSNAELAEVLGVSEEQLAGLTLDEIELSLDNRRATYFNQAKEARAVLSNPAATPAAREAARRTVEGLQELGIDDQEIQFEQLQQKVKEGQLMSFNGKVVDIDTLLTDPYLEGVIAEALANPDKMQELSENEPAFADFIKDNSAIFEELVDRVDSSTQEFISLQEQNAALAKPSDAMVNSFSSDVMKRMGYDLEKLHDTALEPNGLIQLMQSPNFSAEQKRAVESAVGDLHLANPDLIDQFKTLSLDDLTRLGFNNPVNLERLVINQQQSRELTKLDANQDKDAILQKYLGIGDTKKAEALVKEAYLLNQSGFKSVKNPALAILDADNDGKMDSPEQIKARLAGMGTTLTDLLAKGKSLANVNNADTNWGIDLNTNTKIDNPLFHKIKGTLVDGQMDLSELRSLKLSNEDTYTLYTKNMKALSNTAKSALKSTLESNAKKRADAHFEYWTNDAKSKYPILNNYNVSSVADFTSTVNKLKERHFNPDGSPRHGQTPYSIESAKNALNQFREAAFYLAQRTTGLPTDNPFEKSSIKAQAKLFSNINTTPGQQTGGYAAPRMSGIAG